MVVAEVLRLFLEWCREHRSATTVRHYTSRLKTFGQRFGERLLPTLTPLEITAWLSDAGKWRDGRLKSPDTRRANIVAFECFQSWTLKQRVIEARVIDSIEKPRGNMRERIPTDEEIQQILSISSPEFSLIYRALLRTGARPGELAGAKIEQWDRVRGLIVLPKESHKTGGKTGKPRLIGVGEKLSLLLVEAIGGRTEGPIFLSPQCKAWEVSGLSQTFRRVREQLGLDPKIVLYCTRHRAATLTCEKFGIEAAAQALGHTNLQTTRRYVKENTDLMRQRQDQIGE